MSAPKSDANPVDTMIHDEHGPAAPDTDWTPPAHAVDDGQDVTGDDTTGDPLAEFLSQQFITLGSGDNLAASVFIADTLRSAYPEIARQGAPLVAGSFSGVLPEPVSVPRFPGQDAAPLQSPSFSGVLSGTKPSNPKDSLGILKVALSCVSWPVLMEVGVGMLEGALKYGRHNYRVVGVRASVYVDATLRHVGAFWEGEDEDPESAARLSHITKAITSLTVLRDSMIAGNWVDDRPPVTAPKGWLNALNDKVRALLAQYPTPVPPYTQSGVEAKRLFEGGDDFDIVYVPAVGEPSEETSEVG